MNKNNIFSKLTQEIETSIKIEKYFNNPSILDSEESLISCYIKEYKKNGKLAARKAVEKRILAANKIREIKNNYGIN